MKIQDLGLVEEKLSGFENGPSGPTSGKEMGEDSLGTHLGGMREWACWQQAEVGRTRESLGGKA